MGKRTVVIIRRHRLPNADELIVRSPTRSKSALTANELAGQFSATLRGKVEEAMKAKRRAEVQKLSVTPTTRLVELNAESVEVFDRQRERFRRKFGRDPGPNDPIFFDPDFPGSDPVPLTEERIRQVLRKVFVAMETPAALVYASEKTGFLPSEETYKRMRPEDLAKWNAAIAEYFKLEEEARTRARH